MAKKLTRGQREIIRQAGCLLGSLTSPAKAAASRENGKLGGRPKGSKAKAGTAPTITNDNREKGTEHETA